MKITLQNQQSCKIPINYQYPLSSAIYRVLNTASPEFASFLHDQGYIGRDNKPRKLYTFSFLKFSSPYRMTGSQFHLKSSAQLSFILSSPMLQDFIQHFVQGLFLGHHIQIDQSKFEVQQVETLPEPKLSTCTTFTPLSPIVLATMIDTTEGKKTYYYRPEDDELPEAMRLSLIKKHETAYGGYPKSSKLQITIDHEYMEKQKVHGKSVSKLIVLRQGRPDETKVKGFMAPVKMKGSIELMRTAWECGLGDKCSMGFGCVDVSAAPDL